MICSSRTEGQTQRSIDSLLGGWALALWKIWKSVGVTTFPTEWKVIKFHGSKPPTRYGWLHSSLSTKISSFYPKILWMAAKSPADCWLFPILHKGSTCFNHLRWCRIPSRNRIPMVSPIISPFYPQKTTITQKMPSSSTFTMNTILIPHEAIIKCWLI